MVHRTLDVAIVEAAIKDWKHELKGFEPRQWVLGRHGNVALTNENFDVGLFERQWRQPSVVCGHYFFHSRGKEALKAAKEMLHEIFTGPYNVELIIGITPLDKKGALWMNRQLGFVPTESLLDTEVGDCVFVTLSKQDWENKTNE